MKILLLTTRHPFRSPVTGRKRVLQTIISTLVESGHDLQVVALDKPSERDIETSVPVDLMQPPGLLRIIRNIPRLFGGDPWSLNEILFWNPHVKEILKQRVAKSPVDMVVVDMLRMAPYADSLDTPWHLDLDDLLSSRYSGIKSAPGLNLLGYYGERLPRWITALINPIAGLLLRWEGRRVYRREIYWTRKAHTISLVNREESRSLGEATARTVNWLPMSVPDSYLKPFDRAPGGGVSKAVFIGGGDFYPNFQAVRHFKDVIAARFVNGQGGPLTLSIIGQYSPDQQVDLQHAQINFRGYVDDLFAELCQYEIFMAPILSGTGIKTKVLEAMGARLALVVSPTAASGIGLKHMEHAYIAETPEEFAAGFRLLADDSELRAGMVQKAYDHVAEHFSPASLKKRWTTVLKTYETKGEQAE